MKLVIIYLAAPRDWSWLKWSRLDCLKASLKLLKKFGPPAPVIVFHEDYTDKERDELVAIYPNLQLSQVDFSTHIDRYKPGYRDARVGTYGYGMMCRFFSGIVQAHPLLQEFTHYMRLDDDSYFMSPLDAGVMRRIAENDYTYRCTFEDHVPSFNRFTEDFMQARGFKFLGDKIFSVKTAPYTNYHTSSMALWRHPIIKQFCEEIDQRNGAITMGWDDALVQGMIATILCPVLGLKVHMEQGFCYRHNQHCSHREGHGHTEMCRDGNDAHHGGDINYNWGPPCSLA